MTDLDTFAPDTDTNDTDTASLDVLEGLLNSEIEGGEVEELLTIDDD